MPEMKDTFGAGGNWPDLAPKEIAELSKQHKEMLALRRPVRAVYEGTPVMRALGEEYLPREEGESTEAYNRRVKRSFLFNAVNRTTQVLVGKPFSRPIKLGDDVPLKIRDEKTGWAENIDNTGRHLNVFARDLFLDMMVDGISYFLVDMAARPKDESGKEIKLNRGQAKAQDKRPYWVQYRADEVLGWLSEILGGKPRLTQVRLAIPITESTGEFTEETVDGVLVLTPGHWAHYVPIKSDKGEKQENYRKVDEGTTTLDYIPFVPVYAQRTGFMMARPPLFDLAQLNIAHWQSSSDQRHILHVARIPILFASGWDMKKGEKVEIGSHRMLIQKKEGATLVYVEVTGASIEAGRQDLLDLEDQMSDLAMRLLVPKSGDRTATETAITGAEAHSALQAMAEALGDALEVGLQYTADLGKIGKEGGSLEVHTDFGIRLRDPDIAKLITEMVDKKMLSLDTGWDELMRLEILSDAFDKELEKDKLESDQDKSADEQAGMAKLLSLAQPQPAEPQIPPKEAAPPGEPAKQPEGGAVAAKR